MNAQEILGTADFGNNVAAIERQVALAAENQLSVRFAGQPSTQMLILIQRTVDPSHSSLLGESSAAGV